MKTFLEALIGLTISGLTIIGINKIYNMLLKCENKIINAIISVVGTIALAHTIRRAKQWLDEK